MLRRLCWLTAILLLIAASLRFFPWTRGYSEEILSLLSEQDGKSGKGFVKEDSNLVTVISIVFITWFILKGIRFCFGGMASGQLSWPEFENDWASPAYKLIRLLVYT